MISRVLNSRWFALITLICCTASGFLWYIDFQPAILLLVLGALPLALLLVSRRQLTVPLVYHGLLAVFLLTATVGIWAAYQPTPAIQKFWVLVGAVLIFYALASQPLVNVRTIFWGLGLLGVVVAAYFLLTFNPAEHPADLASINQIMLAWAEVRPDTAWSPPEANFVGGILAVLIVCTLALLMAGWRTRRILQAGLAAILLLFQALTLWLTSSRSAWISLAIGSAVWLWWEFSKTLSKRMKTNRARVFEAGLLIAMSLSLVLLILFPSQLFAMAKTVPGAGSAVTRAGVFINAVDLIPDFWLTGGGLQSFAGLYSQYILVIPFLYFKYGYNLYLDVAIEQGVFGLAAVLGIYFSAGVSLLMGFKSLSKRSFTRRRFYPAVFAALFVLAINSVFDDPFYGERSTPLLFVLPGLAVLLLSPRNVPTMQPKAAARHLPQLPGFKYWASGLAVLLIGLAISFYQPLLAAANANFGAAAMAKVELQNFPVEEWSDVASPVDFSSAENSFRQALWYNPSQRTANHRMGLIALHHSEFEQAASYLETAFMADPGHRGIRKALGYTYVWLGSLPKAIRLLSILPETEREMIAYVEWWQLQDRPDLAEQAQRMVDHLRMLNIP